MSRVKLAGRGRPDAWQRAQTERDTRERELATVDAEITKTEAAVERYLAAFENGRLPEDQCATRVRRHGTRLVELRDRHTELTEQLSKDTLSVPSPAYLAKVRRHVQTVLRDGNEAGRKAALQELIHEIQASSRAHIQPIFRVPTEGNGTDPDDADVAGVRAPYRGVRRQGLEPRTRGLRVRCSAS